MIIGLVLYGGIDALSGGTQYDRKLVEYLTAQGDQVVILSLPDHGYLLNRWDDLRGEAVRPLEMAACDLLLIDELVHPSLAMSARLLRKRTKRPVVALVHHLRSDEPRAPILNAWYRRIERRFLNSVDAVWSNTGVTQSRVENLLGRTLPTVVAPPGVMIDPSLAGEAVERRLREPDEPFRLLLVGNMIARKGVETLLQALEQVGSLDWQLTLVGRTDMEPGYVRRIRDRIARNSWQERVRITGPLEGPELAREYQQAHLFVMPSTYEGFGIAYLEAMAFGLPVIASRAGGAVEVVREAENGFLVPPFDPRGVARRIQQVAGDETLRLQLAEGAEQTWKAHPSWETSFVKGQEFLAGLVAK